MPDVIEAVYEHGMLRPLQPLDLAENEHVTLNVSRAPSESERSRLAAEYMDRVREEARDDGPAPGWEEIRRRTAGISGSMAEEIIAGRGDR